MERPRLKTLLFLFSISIPSLLPHLKYNAIAEASSNNLTSINVPRPLTQTLAASDEEEADGDIVGVFEAENECLRCPIETALGYNPYQLEDKRVQKKIRKLQKLVEVTWFKDYRPLIRENGNLIAVQPTSPENKTSICLIDIGSSDMGLYTCLINYTLVPTLKKDYPTRKPAVTFLLDVRPRGRLNDMKPTISHAPTDKLVRRGDNVTFECNRIDTLSFQTTYWFAACTNKRLASTNQTYEVCRDKFMGRYNPISQGKAISTNLLIEYILDGENSDEFKLYNVSDADIGLYGCWVQNNKGVDIRLARLNLLEKLIEPQVLSTTYATPSTTNSPLYPAVSQSPSLSTSVPPTLKNRTDLNKLSIEADPLTNSSSPILKPANYTSPSNKFITTNLVAEPIQDRYVEVSFVIGSSIFMVVIIATMLVAFSWFLRKSILRDKKSVQSNCSVLPSPNAGSTFGDDDNFRRHLPSGECPDIYNIGKSGDGFISGVLRQDTGNLLTQSVCNQILVDKEKNPSISSSNSNSDEASSLGKSTSNSSNSDNSRAFYLHTSDTTTTTVPMYDHPPYTGKNRQFAFVQDACVINPTYGLLRTEPTADWAFPRRNLERLNKIGEGHFGEVWRYIARQKDGKESFVAVKQLKYRAGLGDRERLELIGEIEIMKSVNSHPNVIKLIGYCIDEYEPILVIMEHAENGKLQTYLRDCRSNRKKIITSRELIKFSYHIAKGMEYVSAQGIIHRDLASRNILVSKDRVCKVADFGFARRVSEDCAYERTTGNPVPIKWMAPEALVENKFTSKSDVFSLGILMWEIVTLGATPYENLTSSVVVQIVTAGDRLEQPAHCKNEFFQIMAQCWRHNPTERPTFKEVAAQLEKLLLSENDYIELDQYPEHAYYNIVNSEDKEMMHHDNVT